ncbi:hypothetical protein BGZ61DRAFT_58783 [Ilyonectria robusta]|uniref:uncharacterized protein n=1 Tax=Ilyonectria robusta TaxID=1079257 RepID=UPI001E8E38DA|nr:uncharacterized protein BGZ61DRAFT_58783 [Ilyonectria robusta]KAH8683860.1 hypothetical protein BGZ61DRAFT_58783 [Ilyonectria robusta]
MAQQRTSPDKSAPPSPEYSFGEESSTTPDYSRYDPTSRLAGRATAPPTNLSAFSSPPPIADRRPHGDQQRHPNHILPTPPPSQGIHWHQPQYGNPNQMLPTPPSSVGKYGSYQQQNINPGHTLPTPPSSMGSYGSYQQQNINPGHTLPTPPPSQGNYGSYQQQNMNPGHTLPTPPPSYRTAGPYQAQQRMSMYGHLPTPTQSPSYSMSMSSVYNQNRYGPQKPPTPASLHGTPEPTGIVNPSGSQVASRPQDNHELRRIFEAADKDGVGRLGPAELEAALANNDWPQFHADTLWALLAMFGESDAGSLDFSEFCKLSGFLSAWKPLFDLFDEDRDGYISLEAYHAAIVAFQYRLSWDFVRKMFNVYDKDPKGLNFDSFVLSCANLKTMTDQFKRWDGDRDGYITLPFEDYLSDILPFIRVRPTGQKESLKPPSASIDETPDSNTSSNRRPAPPRPGLSTVMEEKSTSKSDLNTLGEETPKEALSHRSETDDLEGVKAGGDETRDWQDWTTSCPNLPEAISDNLEPRQVFGSGRVWTCTPSKNTPVDKIPLTIGGHPVVIPVPYYYPASAFSIPPPDPHPRFIDPSISLDEDTVNEIFNNFEHVLGFYLFINGMLQLIVPDEFDFQHALSHQPNGFGGLRVSYIPEAMIPTAERQGGPSSTVMEPPTTTPLPATQKNDTNPLKSSTQSVIQPQKTSSSSTNSSHKPARGGDPMNLKIGSMVQAAVEGAKTTDRFQGKIGLITEANDQYYMAVSSHILTQALAAAKSDQFPGKDWKDSVRVIASNGGQEIGQIAETFDPHARTFPHGFLHDISLVDVSSAPMRLVAGIVSPMPTDWLSQVGWNSIRYNSKNLFLLDSPDIRTKSIGILGSQCQMVGQAIFKLREQSEKKTRFRFSFALKKSDSGVTVRPGQA